ncbi:MAG TPA: hypothetical protein DDX92_05665 [Flavobacteriales bacterium]|nr:hypothetical protein [Flavobacteriales bacterium]
MSEHYGKHFVAIIGGSVAGSEAAHILARRGYRVVVFEQRKLPYGKIEDGLPKWHIGLRNKEEKAIDERLNHENIRFVPCTRLGKDITLNELIHEWGFSAVILAIGAWQDRTLPIQGIQKFHHSGLIYQNEFIMWFNHYHEPDYEGIQIPISDGAAIVGGGLASLDVVKAMMILTVQEALRTRDIDADLFTLEKKGIKSVLDDHNLSFKDLSIKPCTLFYRREAADMPLKAKKDDSPASSEQARRVSAQLLAKYKEKYMFNFEPLTIPLGFSTEDGNVSEIQFQRVRQEGRKLVPIEGDVLHYPTELIISSIGSIPENLNSVPSQDELIDTHGELSCRVAGFDNVFAIGNAVTGRGNILESKRHGRNTTEQIIDTHLDPLAEKFKDWFDDVKSGVTENVDEISRALENAAVQSDDIIEGILDKSRKLQVEAGYNSSYRDWIKAHTPVRLEDLIN